MIGAFIFAFALSFVGSLPPGPGNLAVLHTVLNKNTRAGLWVAFGASIPEIPYSFLAVLAVQYVSAFKSFNLVLEIITASVLLIMGIYTLFFQSKKETNLDKQSKAESFQFHPFWKGFIIAVFNPMLVAFWLITSKMADNLGWLDPHKIGDKAAFVLGTAVGAGVLLVCVAFFTRLIRDKITQKTITLINKSIGIMFLVLFLVHGVKLFLKYFGEGSAIV
ncbi:MAG: LysE family transporter [Opitutaceae bacterium]|nr:LysE family transporter [Cytophagales bacterium]